LPQPSAAGPQDASLAGRDVGLESAEAVNVFPAVLRVARLRGSLVTEATVVSWWTRRHDPKNGGIIFSVVDAKKTVEKKCRCVCQKFQFSNALGLHATKVDTAHFKGKKMFL
jgi:hypothetical protein